MEKLQPKLLLYLLLFVLLSSPGYAISTLDTLDLNSSRQGPMPPAPNEEKENTFDSVMSESHYKTLFNGDVKINSVLQEHDQYGHSIWLKRKSEKVKAKYFAYQDLNTDESVYQKYSKWRSEKNIVMVCSGAFTTKDYSTPLGLTVDNGKIVNRKIDSNMDGLVIVYPTGGIVVSDIDDGNLYLGSIKKSVDARDFQDKQTLLNWAQEEEATIFQTQLLVYKNQLRIDKDAPKESAERRLLILAISPEGEVLHIVFNIKKSVYLYNIAEKIFNYLKAKDLNIIAMLNLDTGMYNIMELYDEDGDQEDEVEGDTRLQKATNMLAYFYE